MKRLDHKWMLPSQLDNNSFIWIISFNGIIVDARTLTRDIQVIAAEKGIIPYVYADKMS